MTARDLKRPSTPVPDAAEVEARRAADAARNTEADRYLAASRKKYMDAGKPHHDKYNINGVHFFLQSCAHSIEISKSVAIERADTRSKFLKG